MKQPQRQKQQQQQNSIPDTSQRKRQRRRDRQYAFFSQRRPWRGIMTTVCGMLLLWLLLRLVVWNPSLYSMQQTQSTVDHCARLLDQFLTECLQQFQSIQQRQQGSTSTNNNRTLVIVTGTLRGGLRAWETLYHNVLDENQADLALLVPRPSSDHSDTSSIVDRALYRWFVPDWLEHNHNDWSSAIDMVAHRCCSNTSALQWSHASLPFLPNTNHHNHWYQRLLPYKTRNVQYRISVAIGLVLRYLLHQIVIQLQLFHRYDTFIVTRADHYYLCAHNVQDLYNNYYNHTNNNINTTIWVPRGEDYAGGITDRHMVVPSSLIVTALDTLPPILQFPQNYTHYRHAETVLKARWQSSGILSYVTRFDRVLFTCGAASASNANTRWQPYGPLLPIEGVRLKYKSEYVGAHKTCQPNVKMDVELLRDHWTRRVQKFIGRRVVVPIQKWMQKK